MIVGAPWEPGILNQTAVFGVVGFTIPRLSTVPSCVPFLPLLWKDH